MQACVNFPPLHFLSVLKYSLPISSCSSENIESVSGVNHQNKQNRFVPLSEGVTACAAHPLNGTIVVGTKVCCLEDLISSSFYYSYCSYASSLKNKKEKYSSFSEHIFLSLMP
jgi:hypothetical protein